jgi:hypothetical protein
MRTTIDIPEHLMKRAKMKAVQEGISLKELFTRSLEKELSEEVSTAGAAPWKKLHGKGSASQLKPEDSGFEGYSGPDWNHGVHVNEPDQ